MGKTLKVLLVSMVLAGILVTVLAVTVAAAGPQGKGNGTNTGQVGNSTIEVVSELLGLTPEQIQEQRQAGKSLVEIAATKNVSEETLINAIVAEKQNALEKLVQDGTITQAQADLRLAQMKERVKLAVNRTTVGPQEWAGGEGTSQNGLCNGTGIMRQGGYQGNPENCTSTPGTCTGTGKMMRGNRNAT